MATEYQERASKAWTYVVETFERSESNYLEKLFAAGIIVLVDSLNDVENAIPREPIEVSLPPER